MISFREFITQGLPDTLPHVEVESLPGNLEPIVRAVVTAALYVESKRKDLGEVKNPNSADAVTTVDLTSEKIMAALLLEHDTNQSFFGEELTRNNQTYRKGANHLHTSLDGVDGTLNLLQRTDSDYGPILGRWKRQNNILVPYDSAIHCPHLNVGYAGAVNGDVAIRFKVTQPDPDRWVVKAEDVEKLLPFEEAQKHIYIQYCLWDSKDAREITEIQPWVHNIYTGMEQARKQGNITAYNPPTGGRIMGPSCFTAPLRAEGEDQSHGINVAVAGKMIKLHDIAGALPLLKVLGGHVTNLHGHDINSANFFEEVYPGGIDQLYEDEFGWNLGSTGIGPLIVTPNEHLKNVMVDLANGVYNN